jgi:putative selenate reductase
VLPGVFPGESAFIDSISPRISRSVTVSTLHGCPPDEIERIASYLIEKKHLHTFVKCNPTILGYETARSMLDSMGYDYIVFDEHHFNEDLQYADAVPMFHRLLALAGQPRPGVRPQALQHLPGGRDPQGAALRGDVHGRQVPLPAHHPDGRAFAREFERTAAHLLRRRRRRLQHRPLFACGIWPITMATTI